MHTAQPDGKTDQYKMCGIGGWLGVLEDSENYALRVAEILRHRGPDARGIRSWGEATLIHTRLSVIDLSPAGAQPMANEDGNIWTVFNGEIYNHLELRHHLENRGHTFHGHADTEILPHLYEEYGTGLVSKLRGMFALAIYDMDNHTLLLARDRFGIKPLFYAPGNHRLAFASEIRPLLVLPNIDVRPDRQSVYDFAALFYIPAPETFYAGIRALQPAEMLEARLEDEGLTWKTRAYHSWSINPDPALTLDQAADHTDALLTTAVQQQMESDVPLGSLLSGGIDSSLVSHAAQQASKGGLRTFNVRFSDKDYDETWAALAVADHIGSRHKTLDMGCIPGSWEHITKLLSHAGQPFADTSLFAVNAICRLMRQHVTVALSGDGGDEGFGGYALYWRTARIASLQTLPPVVWHGVSAALHPLARLRVIPERVPRRLADLAEADKTTVVQSMFCWIDENNHSRLCRDTDLLPVRRLFEPRWEYHLPATASRRDRLSAQATEVNARLTLPNDFLFKVDTASMKESLEVRVPMLDEDLFALGLSLPHHLKVHGRTCKRVLRRVAERRLPPSVAKKPKRGFGIPLDTWVDTEFKTRLRDVLLGPSSRLVEFFNPDVYKPVIEAFCDGRTCPGISRDLLYQFVIMLLSIQLTLDRSIHCS